MIYPLLPVFLTVHLGASAAMLGAIEGVAETTSSLLKLYSGIWTDRVNKKKPLVMLGYCLSGLARPLIGLAGSWPFALAIRFFDRVGKGIRTSPRDTLIANATTEESRGRAFGFHRAMDHAGAVVGPIIATALFTIPNFGIRNVFLFAAIPAILAILVLWFFVREESKVTVKLNREPLKWGMLNTDFKKLLAGLFLFTLGNSTDAFLLLRLNSVGVEAKYIALLWSLHHVVKMLSTYIGGHFSDRWGEKPMILSGWLFYAFVYLGFAFANSLESVIFLFLAYGVFYGLTEPAEKSLVSKVAVPEVRGTAFGFYHLTIGVTALPASLIFGLVWELLGPSAAFLMGGTLAVIACFFIWKVKYTNTESTL